MQDTPRYQEQHRGTDEVDIIDYLLILRRRALLISALSIAGLVLAFAFSLLLEDRFKAKAVISPVKEGGGPPVGLSLLVQQLESVPSMSFSSPSSAPEILALLNSNRLRKKLIERHGLLPVIFSDRWDREKKSWRAGERVPTFHDGLRALERSMSVKHSPKDNTITITMESSTAEEAAAMLSRLLTVLNEHLSEEAKRVADSNRRYLESQLKHTPDPLIRQNIYALIAQQIEASMMAGVMENFAFKVIDPPDAPDRRSSPKRHLIALAGFVASMVGGTLLAFVLEFFKSRRLRGDQTGNRNPIRSELERK
ncbi:hypothetical protein BAC1_02154 [uncultured bacterium]|nr:hypothetical protein BAC1_02154 [uncultured bacterium]